MSFGAAQAFATIGAITWNFVLNNLFTYRDQRLTGWHFVTGLIRFQVICAIGAISNVGIATWIYDYDETWWIAGLGGALIGTVWNFVVSAASSGGNGSRRPRPGFKSPRPRASRATSPRRGEAKHGARSTLSCTSPLRGEAGRDSGRERG